MLSHRPACNSTLTGAKGTRRLAQDKTESWLNDVAFFDLPMAKFGPSHYGPATMYSTRPVGAVGETKTSPPCDSGAHSTGDQEMQFEMVD